MIAMFPVDGPAVRVTDQAVFHCFGFDPFGQTFVGFKGSFGFSVFDQLQSAKHATSPNIADVVMLAEFSVECFFEVTPHFS